MRRADVTCQCDLCERSRSFDLALYAGDEATLRAIYDGQCEETCTLQMDLSYAITQLALAADDPEYASAIAADALTVLRSVASSTERDQ